jgi:D-amino peptidase
MRFLVSVDMEGVAGVVDPEHISPGHSEYERYRRYMTDEASAVVRGLLAAEPDASVVVCDAHAGFRNLVPDQLSRGCRLVQGTPRRHGMLAGIDDGVDAVLLVGYHGAAGAEGSVLAHTMSGGTIAQVRWDGEALGEVGLGVRLAAHYGATTILASGDDTACAEAEKEAPGVVAVAVKRALGNRAADSLHPADACEQLEAGAAKAAAHRAPPTSPARSSDRPVVLEVDLLRPIMADRVARIPGAGRDRSNTVTFRLADIPTAYELIDLVIDVAAA